MFTGVLINWIGENIGWGKVLVGLIIMGFLASFGIVKLELTHAKTKLAEANKQLKIKSDSYVELQTSFENYQKTVRDVAEQEKQRSQKAVNALNIAKTSSSKDKSKGSSLASLKAPTTIPRCDSALDIARGEIE